MATSSSVSGNRTRSNIKIGAFLNTLTCLASAFFSPRAKMPTRRGFVLLPGRTQFEADNGANPSGGTGTGGSPTDNAGALQAEHARVFAEGEAELTEWEGLLAKPSPTAAETARMAELQTANTRRQSRLETLTGAINTRKKFAAQRLADGQADVGLVIPGTNPTISVQDRQQNVKQQFSRGIHGWANTGQIGREFATIITTTGSSILLPSTVLPVFAPTQDHVIARAQADFGVPVISLGTTAQSKMPVPDINAGQALTEGDESGTAGTQTFAGSVVLSPKPYSSNQYWESNTAVAAPGYDLMTQLLPMLVYEAKLAEEAACIGAIKGTAGLISASTRTTSTSALNYADVMSWAGGLPSVWESLGVVHLLSSDGHSAVEGLTSSDGNRGVQWGPDGKLRIRGNKAYKTSALDAFGAINRVIGITFCPFAVRLRTEQPLRMNRYTDKSRRDQIGFEVVEDHAYAFIAAGVKLLVTPAS